MTPDELALIEEVRTHVPVQPWGRSGNAPEPVECFYHRPGEWHVRFVAGLVKGSHKERRRWLTAEGSTLLAALREARRKQEAEQWHV